MPDTQQDKQNEFMIEKIKERPVNKKKLIRRTIITAAMAVIFGLIACLTFLILEPVFSNWLYPEEEPRIVVFPEDQEEMSPEEMLSDSMQTENDENASQESVVLEEEQIQEILSGLILSKDNYRQIYTALSNYTAELNQYMVVVTGISSEIDWFNNITESKEQSSGVIVFNNGRELLILADYTPIQESEKLTLTFHNNLQTEGHVKQIDPNTNLAILSVNLSELPNDMAHESIKIATLGSSNVKSIVGMPIIAMGSPMGTSGSVGYGIIAAASSQMAMWDVNYKLLITDIYGSQTAGGVLFNLQGQVIGIITNGKSSQDMKNVVTAYGISELKKIVEKMSNSIPVAYMGIKGVDVTKEAHDEQKVPYGAYVKEVAIDSPAMMAGIQQGDVIVAINEELVPNYSEYTTLLMDMAAGRTIELTVMRLAQEEYKEMTFQITLEEVK